MSVAILVPEGELVVALTGVLLVVAWVRKVQSDESIISILAMNDKMN